MRGLRYVLLVNPGFYHQRKQRRVLSGEMEWSDEFYIPDAWRAGEWGKYQVWQWKRSTIVKEFLIFPNQCITMAQGVCDQVSIESLCTSLWRIKKSMDKGDLWYQHECGNLFLRLQACGIWGGKQVHHESARLFPWVELSDPDKRSFHHSAVIVVTVIGLLWSLWWAQLLEILMELGCWV